MLEKTFALLAQYRPATYVEEDVECYDDAEIEELGRALAALVYAPSKLRKKLQSMGATITRADFYSEIPTIAELETSFSTPSLLKLDYPFRDNAFLREFLTELTVFAKDFDPPVQATREGEYSWEGGAFSFSDAMSYYCMIRRYRPNTIVEIGCGASTMVASLACEHNSTGRIVAIEPYPAPYVRDIPRVELIQKRAQEIDSTLIESYLQDDDILFIDSTHTVKHDSDCLHIYLRILPHLTRKLLVHVHDIFLPDTLQITSMRDQQLFWNEQYLLYAYLIGNPRTKVLYGSNHHTRTNPEMLHEFMQGRYGMGGVSLWFAQSGAVRA
jgi:hypothetical protein